MPWVVRDAVDDINRAVGRRWLGLYRLLPPRAELPEGCAAPFVTTGANGRPAGLAACRHEHIPDGRLNPRSRAKAISWSVFFFSGEPLTRYSAPTISMSFGDASSMWAA